MAEFIAVVAAVHSPAMNLLAMWFVPGASGHAALLAATWCCAVLACLLLLGWLLPRAPVRIRYASLFVFGCTGLLYSALQWYTIRYSPDATMTGQVEKTRFVHRGRNSHYEFRLLNDGRVTRWFEWMPRRQPPDIGTSVSVTFHQWDDSDVLDLNVLNGPQAGYVWHTYESPRIAVISILPSLVLLAIGAIGWARQRSEA